jgi:hypothetical protein
MIAEFIACLLILARKSVASIIMKTFIILSVVIIIVDVTKLHSLYKGLKLKE